jgi:hypothetical protein
MKPYFERILQPAPGLASVVLILNVPLFVQGRNSPVNRLGRALADPVESVSGKDSVGDPTRQLTGVVGRHLNDSF